MAITNEAFADTKQCEGLEFLSPQDAITERQPLIRWKGVPGAKYYRVELESRVPEGKTIVQLDTRVVGTSFRLPQSLTDFRARVAIKVTPHCADAPLNPRRLLSR